MTEIKNHTFKKMGIYSIFFLFTNICLGQNAENLFSDQKKWGISLNRSTYFAKNEPNSVDYKLYNQSMFSLGFTYNFYQIGNHNFKASVIKNFKNWETASLKLKKEDISSEYDYEDQTSIRIPNSQWKFNLLYEYVFRLGRKNFSTFSIGPEILYYPKIRAGGSTGYGINPGEVITRVTEKTERVQDFNPGLKMELSAYFKTNIGMFQLRADGLIGFNDYQRTETHAFNLEVSPETYSKHIIKGHYLGLGLTYYFNKREKGAAE